MAFLDRCIFVPTASGSADWTVSAAVLGFRTPVTAGAVNAGSYNYVAQSVDLTQWEIGTSTYTTAGTVAARTTVLSNSSGNTSKINFTGVPVVMYGCGLAFDIAGVENPNTWTGIQTFNDGKLVLAGSSSGAGTLKAPAAASTFVWTLPAATDTLAGLGGTNSWSGVNTYTNTTDSTTGATGAINTLGGIGATKKIVAGTGFLSLAGTGIDASFPGASQNGGVFRSDTTSNSSMILFTNPNGVEGSITLSGTTTVYNTTSDERVKTKFDEDGIDWGARIDALWIGGFQAIDNPRQWRLGLRAQQAYGIVPQGITRPKTPDDMFQVDYGMALAPLAMWGVKNLRDTVKALQARLATLEKK